MKFLPVPKILKWTPSIPQHYSVDRGILLTSGCSFTANTLQTDFCASWPGFVLDRCGFEYCVDWSYPGAGNEFIGDSIMYQIDAFNNAEREKCIVIVMWSGIDRKEQKIINSNIQPLIGGVEYQRISNVNKFAKFDKSIVAQESADKIFEVKKYLEDKNIPYVFSFYSNLLFPPYIPKRDTTHEFEGYVDKNTLAQLRAIPWIPNRPMDFMFEYAFKNNLLHDDLFHPGPTCSEKWTDEILLPEMFNRGMIKNHESN